MTTRYHFKLFVFGGTDQSRDAETNLRAVCDERVKGRYHLDVIDLSENIQIAEDEEIFATPVVERLLPKPMLRIIGNMTNKKAVISGLDIT